MKSVVLENVSKVYSVARKNFNFKELIGESLRSVFDSRKKNDTTDFYALKNISFELEQGDVLGIIGDNGAGKSTLLKIISGVSQSTSGSVILQGKISSILEIGTGFHMELSGKENIYLSGSILGMTRKEIEERYDSIVRFSGLNEFINVAIKRYSSGMYLRLAFSVLAHLSTDIILLDEIIYVGDAEFKMKSYNKIKELARSGKTILIVSHDLSSISDLCTKCLLLEKGEVKLSGKTSDIVRMYLDKSLRKYINTTQDEQQSKTQEELNQLQAKIRQMDAAIREKENALNRQSSKEEDLISELNRMKYESFELNKIKDSLEKNADAEAVKQIDSEVLTTEKVWENEKQAPGNDIIRMKRIAYTSENLKHSASALQGEEITFEVEYWKYIDDPIVIGLTAIYNFNQVVLGTSSSLVEEEGTGIHNAGKGVFKHTFTINKYLLNHGFFTIGLYFLKATETHTEVSTITEVYALHNAIVVRVEYNPDFKKFQYIGNLVAPFTPAFRWS